MENRQSIPLTHAQAEYIIEEARERNRKENLCFGVGNIDSICFGCLRNEECQSVIRDKVCGMANASSNKYGMPTDVNCKAILNSYIKQCKKVENAFAMKVHTEDDSPLRKEFARHVGRKEAMEEILADVFGIHTSVLKEIEVKVRLSDGF